jgi:N-acetylglutamate synthase-like GNAT family acetyltransferase
MPFQVRTARPGDAEAVVNILRRSIRELCIADHKNDPTILEWWLSNKTAKNVLAWLNAEDNYMVVAEDQSRVCGAALLNRTGEIRLCYLLPEVKARGVGHALLTSLEVQAKLWGLNEVFLKSTATAQSFYERHGYRPKGSAVQVHGDLSAVPFSKTVAL